MFGRRRTDEDFAAEIQAHIELESDRLRAEGISEEAARAAARRAFGNVTAATERFYEASRWVWLDQLRQDLLHACRLIRRYPASSIAAIAILALSIGATTAIFSAVNAVMLRPLPYAEPHRLVVMWGTDRRRLDSLSQRSADLLPRNRMLANTIHAERWLALSRSFDKIGWYRSWSFTLTGLGEPERIPSALVSADFFACLGIPTMLGRTFVQAEISPGSDTVVVLSERLWRSRFQSDRQVIGKTIVLDGVTRTIIGVMPRDFRPIAPYIASDTDIYAPISQDFRGRNWSIVTVIARLKSGVWLVQAQAEMDAIAKGLESEGRLFQGRGVNLVPLERETGYRERPALLIFLGAAGCVLLLACANLAGLTLSRMGARGREIALRTALGAGRSRVARQLLTESLLIAFAGGALGLLLSQLIARTFVSLSPVRIQRLDEVQADATVFLFVLAASGLAGVLIGLWPAIWYSCPDANGVLKGGGSREGRLISRRLLVAGQVALASLLLIGTGLLLRSFALLKAVDPGFAPERLLTVNIRLPESEYGTPQQQASFATNLAERVCLIPSVRSAAVSNSLPLSFYFTVSARIQIEGRQIPEAESGIYLRAVSPGYFRTMGIPLVRGRDFVESDQGRFDAVIVNQTAANHFWPGEDPLGRRILGDKPRTVVGVVADIKDEGPARAAAREMYLPFAEQPAPYLGLAVRTSGDPRQAVAGIRAVVRSMDPNQPIDNPSTMQDALDQQVAQPRFNLLLIGTFAALALVLATIGIYGVVSTSAAQRTREIGIRVALGAESRKVMRMFLAEGALLAAAGLAAGVAVSLGATRVLRSYLFEVSPHDGLTYAAVSVVLFAVCLLATYVPARRAARSDPMSALRHE